jgi:hypothetical protein
MEVCFTLRFGPGSTSPKYLRRFGRRLTRWIDRQWTYDFCHPEVDQSDMNDLRTGELPMPQSLRLTQGIHGALQLPDVTDTQREIMQQFLRSDRDTLSHGRHLSVVLRSTEFCEFTEATASFERFLKDFPEIVVERQNEI